MPENHIHSQIQLDPSLKVTSKKERKFFQNEVQDGFMDKK
jgi:hypothetical protein